MITGIEEENGRFKVWAQAGGATVWWIQPTESAACQALTNLRERISDTPEDMILTAACEIPARMSLVSFLELA